MNAVMYEVLTLTLIFAIPTLGLNIISGYGGMFSVAQAALFGVGAFTYAGADRLLSNDSLLLIWAMAIVAGLVISLIVALVSARVSGDFFIIASFGLQLVVIQVAFNWTAVSGGASGAYGLLPPTILGQKFTTPEDFLFLAAIAAAVTYAISAWVVLSPFGRLLRAMRDDEAALAAAGFSGGRLRSAAFVFGGILAAVGGALYAGYQGVAQTGDFGVSVSIMLLAAVIVGGSGSIFGSILGALLFVGAPRLLNLIHVSDTLAGSLQQLLFGVLVVLVMAFLRGGIVQLLTAPFKLLRRDDAEAESASPPRVEGSST
jgi:branched-chain amino acid transport system permease protein